jgi:hypothetical protein
LCIHCSQENQGTDLTGVLEPLGANQERPGDKPVVLDPIVIHDDGFVLDRRPAATLVNPDDSRFEGELTALCRDRPKLFHITAHRAMPPDDNDEVQLGRVRFRSVWRMAVWWGKG